MDFLSDVRVVTAKLKSNLDVIYCRCFPMKVKYVSAKRLDKPWITSGILRSIRTKSQYFKLFKLGVIDDHLNRKYKNCLNSVIRTAKRNL